MTTVSIPESPFENRTSLPAGTSLTTSGFYSYGCCCLPRCIRASSLRWDTLEPLLEDRLWKSSDGDQPASGPTELFAGNKKN